MSDPFKGVINCASCGSMNDSKWTKCCSCGVEPLEDAEGYCPEQAASTPAVAEAAIVRPKLRTRWRHRNGAEYTVWAFTNTESTNPDYPETIVYHGDNGNLWSRPLSDWHRSMTKVG